MLALLSVATVRVGDRDLYVVGGERLGKEFLASLVLPAEYARAAVFESRAGISGSEFAGCEWAGAGCGPLRAAGGKRRVPIRWSSPRKFAGALTPASAEMFHAVPLQGRQKELLGVLFVGVRNGQW